MISSSVLGSKLFQSAENILYPNYFSKRQSAQLAIFLSANNEMSIEDIARVVPHITNKNTFVKQLSEKSISFSKLRTQQDSNDNYEVEISEDLIQECKTSLEKSFNTLSKRLLDTGLQQKFTTSLFAIKKKQLEASLKSNEQTNKAQYLTKLIQIILSRLGQQPTNELIEQIVKYGIEAIYTQTIFMRNHNLRDNFKNILHSCNTFKTLKESLGVNPLSQKNNLIKDIFKNLLQLQIEEKTSQEICNELLINPASNIVAHSDKLTNCQKLKLYKSSLYTKGTLRSYAQVIDYKESLEYKATREIFNILQLIEQQFKLTKQIVKNVISYDIYGLLKIPLIQTEVNKFFQFIIQKCPIYLKIFKIIRQKDSDISEIKQSSSINRRFNLINIFLQIKLPFEEWQYAEKGLLQRKYQIVDDLSLNSKGRQSLFTHIFDILEPSFHKQQNSWDQKYEVQFTLIKQLIKMQNLSFDKILKITREILSSNNFKSQTAEQQLSKSQKNIYQVALKNKDILDFQKNENTKQRDYQKGWQFKRKIYSINKEDRVSVPYSVINQFVIEIISQQQIPGKTQTYITNMVKFIPMIQNQFDSKVQDKEAKFAQLAHKFVQAFRRRQPQGKFIKYLNQKFKGNIVGYVKSIIEKNGMEENNNTFFESLQIESFPSKQAKKQFTSNNKEEVLQLLNECKQILYGDQKPIKQPSSALSSNSPIKKQKNYEEQFKTVALTFYQNYINVNEDSRLKKICEAKFNNDPVSLIKEMIKTKVFDQNNEFFSKLDDLGSFLVKKIKNEIAQKKDEFLTKLKRCIEIYPYLQ